MHYLIFSQDNSISPTSEIGLQKWGIIFWQKTGFLQHCNELGFVSIIKLIEKKFSPTSVQFNGRTCTIKFNDDLKSIFLALKQEQNSKHLFIYGEARTALSDPDFHLFALEIVTFIAKNIGSKFYVDDATGYLEHRSINKLNEYIDCFNH